jgi:predicted DNA-binding transcriptional regulator AlpA
MTGPELGNKKGSEMTRRSVRVRAVSTGLGDAPRKDAAVTHRASSVSRDNAYPETGDDLLTDAQLAARWQLSRGTLANQRSQGRGPAYLKLAGRVRYRRSDIEAYEQAGFVSRESAGETTTRGPNEVRETVERLIQSVSS